jgi:hypothetical protein
MKIFAQTLRRKLLPQSSTLKMGAAGSSETLVTSEKNIRSFTLHKHIAPSISLNIKAYCSLKFLQ